MVVREAMRGQAYVQHFNPNYTPESEVLLLDYADIIPQKITLSNCIAIAGSPLPAVTAEAILGLLLARETKPLPKSEQKPLYIRAPDAKLPKSPHPPSSCGLTAGSSNSTKMDTAIKSQYDRK
jgi:hypothetical protein